MIGYIFFSNYQNVFFYERFQQRSAFGNTLQTLKTSALKQVFFQILCENQGNYLKTFMTILNRLRLSDYGKFSPQHHLGELNRYSPIHKENNC